MKCIEIQRVIAQWLIRADIIVFSPNVSALLLFEADFVAINKGSYFFEYEIKTSRADFKRDCKKEISTWCHIEKIRGTKTKYDFLKNGYQTYKRPNRFYYVVPANLISIEEIPDFAGLIYVNEYGRVKIVKAAPMLHKEKVTDKFKLDIARNICIKYASKI